MKNRLLRLALVASAPLLAALAACSSGADAGGVAENGVSGAQDLEIHFPKMYSAFAPGHEFKIPVAVEGVKSVKWSVSDPEVADIEKQPDGSAMITVRKAGTVDVVAKAGSLEGTAQLVVTPATADEWEAGNQRYNNGIVLKRGEGRRDGGAPPSDDPSRKQAACTNCHGGAAGAGESNDVEHTPMQTAGYSDRELVDIFTKGTKPAGVPQRVMMSKERWKRIHQWSMDENAVKGLVVYLRSLEPKSQGDVDFGGWGHGKGKGGGDRSGDKSAPGGASTP